MIIPTASTQLNLPDLDGLPPHLAAKYRANPPQWLVDMRAENARTGTQGMSNERMSVEDQLEDAWLSGEISHADACAELAELEGSGE